MRKRLLSSWSLHQLFPASSLLLIVLLGATAYGFPLFTRMNEPKTLVDITPTELPDRDITVYYPPEIQRTKLYQVYLARWDAVTHMYVHSDAAFNEHQGVHIFLENYVRDPNQVGFKYTAIANERNKIEPVHPLPAEIELSNRHRFYCMLYVGPVTIPTHPNNFIHSMHLDHLERNPNNSIMSDMDFIQAFLQHAGLEKSSTWKWLESHMKEVAMKMWQS